MGEFCVLIAEGCLKRDIELVFVIFLLKREMLGFFKNVFPDSVLMGADVRVLSA